ncbi:MAG: hypothetical protein ACTHK0_18185 [Ginsengibacter sp.]
MADKNHEFVIRFEGVNLSKEASERIQNRINDLLVKELSESGAVGASADGDDNYCGIYIPHKWIGRQILVANLSRLQEVAKEQTLGSAIRVETRSV